MPSHFFEHCKQSTTSPSMSVATTLSSVLDELDRAISVNVVGLVGAEVGNEVGLAVGV